MFAMLQILISDAVFAMIVPGISLGILSIIASIFIPPLFSKYKIPLQLGGLILIIFFVFQSGRYSESIKYKEQSLLDKVEISALKAKSAEINTETVIQYVDKIKIVEKIKEVKVNVYVTKEADSMCVIDPATGANITRLLNAAAVGKLP
jgi:hypothetical protein